MQSNQVATIGEGFQADRFSESQRAYEVALRIKESLRRLLRQGVESEGLSGLGLDNIPIPDELLGEIALSSEERYKQYELYRKRFDNRESFDPQLNAKFGNKKDISVSELLNNLIAFDTPYKDFAKALLDSIGEIGNIRVKLVPYSTPEVIIGDGSR